MTDHATSMIASAESRINGAASSPQLAGPAVAAPIALATVALPSIFAESNTAVDFLNYNLGDTINEFSTSDVIPASSNFESPNNYGSSLQTIIGGPPREG